MFYTINQEILKFFYSGRNLQGRTEKGPKPLGAKLEEPKPLAFWITTWRF